VLVRDNVTLSLLFNETMYLPYSLPSYSFENYGGTVVNETEIPTAFHEIVLTLSNPISAGNIYTITISGLEDCAGNTIENENTALFGLPEFPDSNDLIINEVLFNPETSGVDFVELYNRSQKVIDLKNIYMVRNDFSNQDSTITVTRVTTDGLQLVPGQYAALTENRDYILGRYETPNPKYVFNVRGMPNYPDQSGVVIVMDTLLNEIDRLVYEEKWHSPLVDDKNGVSLERIRFERATQDQNNWFSAASTVGYATPAYKNSQAATDVVAEGMIRLEPEAFSPDGDGYNDFLNIIYQFDEPGWVANIHIYDANGRLIRKLIENELLAMEGILKWDGTDDNENKARIGIHIVWAEFFKPDGKVQYFKKRCVVAGKIK